MMTYKRAGRVSRFYLRKRQESLGRAYSYAKRSVLARAASAMLLAIACLLSLAAVSCTSSLAHADTIPRAAQLYQLTLKREAQRVWGLDAPVATFAAQIHQESRWNASARSPVGALGLTQFMPATARWIGSTDAALANPAPLNPTWAIRALVSYDHWLAARIKAADDCQRMAFALSAYNGGLGWVYKRQQRSATPGVCLGSTCEINPGITAASQAENAHYPQVILHRFEPLYVAARWGAGSCP
jgi:soluble lytic murein transglycosylase-like protein